MAQNFGRQLQVCENRRRKTPFTNSGEMRSASRGAGIELRQRRYNPFILKWLLAAGDYLPSPVHAGGGYI
jgi:hypothetical protein